MQTKKKKPKTSKKKPKTTAIFQLDPQIAANDHLSDSEMDTEGEHALVLEQARAMYTDEDFAFTPIKAEQPKTPRERYFEAYEQSLPYGVAGSAIAAAQDTKEHLGKELWASREALALLSELHESLREGVWALVETHVVRQLGGFEAAQSQPLYRFLYSLRRIKEMHTRLLKKRPGTGGGPVRAVWGGEELDGVTAPYRTEPTYSIALLVPAASDIDPRAEDELPDDVEAMLRDVCRSVGFNVSDIPQPVGVVARTAQINVLRLLHAVVHMFEYLHAGISQSCTGLDPSTRDPDAVLDHVLGRWRHRPLAEWSANPKKASPFVLTAVKLRYSLVAAWDLLERFTPPAPQDE